FPRRAQAGQENDRQASSTFRRCVQKLRRPLLRIRHPPESSRSWRSVASSTMTSLSRSCLAPRQNGQQRSDCLCCPWSPLRVGGVPSERSACGSPDAAYARHARRQSFKLPPSHVGSRDPSWHLRRGTGQASLAVVQLQLEGDQGPLHESSLVQEYAASALPEFPLRLQ